jgi:four helix bundle protein
VAWSVQSRSRVHPADELKQRTRAFASAIVDLCEEIAGRVSLRTRDQLEAAGTGIGANHLAACRAKSHDDFTAKIATAAEEAEETVYWLDVLIDTKRGDLQKLRNLRSEAGELLAIMAASHKTARHNQEKRRSERREKAIHRKRR